MHRLRLDPGVLERLNSIVADYLKAYPGHVRLYVSNDRYVYVSCRLPLHRILADAEKGQEVDHINGDGFDNTLGNLRAGTPSSNRSNQRAPKRGGKQSSRYRGVCLHRSRKGDTTTRWRAHISANKSVHHLGYFKAEEDAARAFDAAALAHHGPDYRWFNFPTAARHMKTQHPDFAEQAEP